MAGSLQEQLLKAGLVDQKKSKQIKQEKRKQAKQVKQGKALVDDVAERARKAREEQAQRNREINAAKQAAAETRALKAQARQLIDQHRIERPEEGATYQFVDGKKIKRLIVTDKQVEQLARGVLGIVRRADSYELVPAATARKIQERWAEAVVLVNDVSSEPADGEDDEDPYADYKIPDDLMW